MCRDPRSSAWLATALLAALAFCPALARGEDDDRKKLLRAFDTLRKDVQEKIGDVAVTTVLSDIPQAVGKAEVVDDEQLRSRLVQVKPLSIEVQGNPMETTNIVKVWAELTDGKKVSLTGYDWQPKERFYLCFETAVPVHFAVHYTPRDGGPTLVLPNRKYTKSYETILPGKPYTLPIRMKMEDTDDPERMTLTFVTVAGPAPSPSVRRGKIRTKAAEDYCNEMDELAKQVRARGLRMRTLEIEPGGRNSVDDPNAVALLAVTTDNRGFIELTMRKQR
jgi:hypothetical protein